MDSRRSSSGGGALSAGSGGNAGLRGTAACGRLSRDDGNSGAMSAKSEESAAPSLLTLSAVVGDELPAVAMVTDGVVAAAAVGLRFTDTGGVVEPLPSAAAAAAVVTFGGVVSSDMIGPHAMAGYTKKIGRNGEMEPGSDRDEA